MNELAILGDLGERIDSRLVDAEPLGYAEGLANQLIELRSCQGLLHT
jgi:hypothetical protein